MHRVEEGDNDVHSDRNGNLQFDECDRSVQISGVHCSVTRKQEESDTEMHAWFDLAQGADSGR